MGEARKNLNRRLLGLLLGACLGFLNALVSGTINLVFIRDLPVYYEPISLLNQILWMTLSGAVMGFVVNLPEAGLLGVVLASLLGALTVFVGTILNAMRSYGSYGLVLVSFLYVVLPMMVFFLPLSVLLRWAAAYFEQPENNPWWKWRSLRVRLILAGLAILVGSFPLYSSEARAAMHAVDDVIRDVQGEGLEAAPYPFRAVSAVVLQADHEYMLEWTDDLQRFPYSLIGEDNTSGFVLQLVFAHFKSGEVIACLLRDNSELYMCEPVQ